MRLLAFILISYLLIMPSAYLSANEVPTPKVGCENLFTYLRGQNLLSKKFLEQLKTIIGDEQAQRIYEVIKDRPDFGYIDQAILWVYKLPYGPLSLGALVRMLKVVDTYPPKDLYKIINSPMSENSVWAQKPVLEQQAILNASFFLLGYSAGHWGTASRQVRVTSLVTDVLAKLKSGDSEQINWVNDYYSKLTMYTPFQVYMSPGNNVGTISRIFNGDSVLFSLAKMVELSKQDVAFTEAIDELIVEEISHQKSLEGLALTNSQVHLDRLYRMQIYLKTPAGKAYRNITTEEIKKFKSNLPSGTFMFTFPRNMSSMATRLTRQLIKAALVTTLVVGPVWAGWNYFDNVADRPPPVPQPYQIETIKIESTGVQTKLPIAEALNDFKSLKKELHSVENSSLPPAEQAKRLAEIRIKIEEKFKQYPDLYNYQLKLMTEGQQ